MLLIWNLKITKSLGHVDAIGYKNPDKKIDK